MDDNAKNASSFQLDQEILDARGINMTVEEVAGLSTVKYAERVQSLHLNSSDLGFLKGLRRRIKNRLASQNSRRRNMEHLRRLTRELRAVRQCRDDTLSERRELVVQRDRARAKCRKLRDHVAKILQERSDRTVIPSIDVRIPEESHKPKDTSIKKMPQLEPIKQDLFECRLEKLVQQSVNHIYKDKKIYAKTVFISNEHTSDVKSMVLDQMDLKDDKLGDKLGDKLNDKMDDGYQVLNLSVKSNGEKRRSHGRKQSAPRRICYAIMDHNDGVLDLKVNKEPQ